MAGRKIYIFVQETWLVNTPTLILNSVDMYLQHRVHPLIVSEKKNKNQTMISSIWGCQIMLIWTFLSKMVGFQLRNPVHSASLGLVSGQCCVRSLEKYRFQHFCTALYDKTRTMKGSSATTELFYKTELGGKESFSPEISFKECLQIRFKTRPS